jgi:hypothetical protein
MKFPRAVISVAINTTYSSQAANRAVIGIGDSTYSYLGNSRVRFCTEIRQPICSGCSRLPTRKVTRAEPAGPHLCRRFVPQPAGAAQHLGRQSRYFDEVKTAGLTPSEDTIILVYVCLAGVDVRDSDVSRTGKLRLIFILSDFGNFPGYLRKLIASKAFIAALLRNANLVPTCLCPPACSATGRGQHLTYQVDLSMRGSWCLGSNLEWRLTLNVSHTMRAR